MWRILSALAGLKLRWGSQANPGFPRRQIRHNFSRSSSVFFFFFPPSWLFNAMLFWSVFCIYWLVFVVFWHRVLKSHFSLSLLSAVVTVVSYSCNPHWPYTHSPGWPLECWGYGHTPYLSFLDRDLMRFLVLCKAVWELYACVGHSLTVTRALCTSWVAFSLCWFLLIFYIFVSFM